MLEEKSRKARTKSRSGKKLPSGHGNDVQLLLVQTVSPLGRQGDIVDVKKGYAENYLIPQGLATVATEHHRRMVEKHKARLQETMKRRLANLQALAERIANTQIRIEARANEANILYGAVGPDEIVLALKEHGIEITPDQVRMEGPIKELALYTILINLGHGIKSELKLWVAPIVEDEAAK
ncbi:MAG: 50S ribosomal protein L9 [Planctomycetia bacterium]|nr:50S ribosomal protein L9 [Planctomycetia bacterium]